MYFDPSGHAITSWDLIHCTSTEIGLLAQYSIMWKDAREANDGDDMAYWHNECENIRNRHRQSWEMGTGNGDTKINFARFIEPGPVDPMDDMKIGIVPFGVPSLPIQRVLTAADLGLTANVINEVSGTINIANGICNVKVDMIAANLGKMANIQASFNSLINLAKSNGASVLKIEASFANEKLMRVIGKFYTIVTEGGKDIIKIVIK